MKSYDEKYVLPLCKLAINSSSPYKKKWLMEIVNFVYDIHIDKTIDKHKIKSRVFYDIDDSWSIREVIKDIKNDCRTGHIKDLSENFRSTLDLEERIDNYQYKLRKYCFSLWDSEKEITKEQIYYDLLTTFSI